MSALGGFGSPVPMLLGIRPLAMTAIQVIDDPVGIFAYHRPVLGDQGRDLIAARLSAEFLSVGRVGRDLASHKGDAELGESLAHTAGVRAPFGLLELIHLWEDYPDH